MVTANGNQNFMAHIDMVTFDLPQSCKNNELTQIEIDDTSVATVHSLDPDLGIHGITVEYYK
jgi:hypothetical protein